MTRSMTTREFEELEALARRHCESLAVYRERKAAGVLGRVADQKMRQYLNALDLRLQRLQSANELERSRARVSSNVVEIMDPRLWRAAK